MVHMVMAVLVALVVLLPVAIIKMQMAALVVKVALVEQIPVLAALPGILAVMLAVMEQLRNLLAQEKQAL